jgi:hypothetical protein
MDNRGSMGQLWSQFLEAAGLGRPFIYAAGMYRGKKGNQ